MLSIVAIVLTAMALVSPTIAQAYDFGDYRSTTLASKAWAALEKGDIEAVLAYTNKCMELYGEQAKKMQASLSDYPKGTNEEIFGFWALNDVATCLFIQGEAYRKAKMTDEAKEVFKKLMTEYTYGQCWDTKGWFWKPAEAAKEKLASIESGSTLDFGDYTSESLTTKAWVALKEDKLDEVLAYVGKTLELYEAKAKEMQASLKEYPWESKDKIFSFWALNDVGTSLFIRGEAFKKAGKIKEAKESYKKLVDEFSYAQSWDPQGWFWKPSEAAVRELDALKDQE
ncbi:MAG: tetratricopeptide repeat protein [Candidatus Omnitrophota bacterium]